MEQQSPMRAFVAIGLPPEVSDDLDTSLAPVGSRLTGLPWTVPERRHLTLVFLRQVTERQRLELEERLRRAAVRTPVLSLRLAGGGHFGRRVAWVGLTGDRAALRRLAERAVAAARRAGIDVENRPYRPHVSVARAPGTVDGEDVVGAASALTGYSGPLWRVTSIDLVRSIQGPRPVHEVLRTFPLGEPTGTAPSYQA